MQYSEILLKTREVRALVTARKWGAAERAAEGLRAMMKAYLAPGGPYFLPPAIDRVTADPCVLADLLVAHAESAHPVALEIVVLDMVRAVSRIHDREREAVHA